MCMHERMCLYYILKKKSNSVPPPNVCSGRVRPPLHKCDARGRDVPKPREGTRRSPCHHKQKLVRNAIRNSRTRRGVGCELARDLVSKIRNSPLLSRSLSRVSKLPSVSYLNRTLLPIRFPTPTCAPSPFSPTQSQHF